MDNQLIERGREALDSWRYDPPAWTGTQILILVLVLLFGGAALYYVGKGAGIQKTSATYEARMQEAVARVRAEDAARAAAMQADLETLRREADAQRARGEAAEQALIKALDEAAKSKPVKVATACDAPVEPLNTVIKEVNRGRR